MASLIRWWAIAVIMAALASAQQHSQKRAIEGPQIKVQFADSTTEKDRVVRQSNLIKAKAKPMGFFGTIGFVGRLIFDQFNETKSAISQISTLFNGQFTDGPQASTTPAPITDNSTTTTEAPPRISRSEFLQLLSRNLKGLRRLYNLELREAMKDSRKNVQEYGREFNRKIYEQFKD